MNHIKEVLKKLDQHDMHIHEIRHGEPDCYEGMDEPPSILQWRTHYIMQGEKIIRTGTTDTIEAFVLSL